MMTRVPKQGRACRRSAFTLIELLVVVAIIALLISILLPSLARARELSKRTVCAANLKGCGTGFYSYAADNSDMWPIAAPHAAAGGSGPGTGAVTWSGSGGNTIIGNDAPDVDNEALGGDHTVNINPATGWTKLSTTRNMYTLIREGGSAPGSFVCPSSEDQPSDIDNPQDFWDFGVGEKVAGTPNVGPQKISYGYQVPYGDVGLPSSDRDQRMALCADKGPYGVYFEQNKGGAVPAITADKSSSPDDWRAWNSPNHGGIGDGEGQVILFADSHAEFKTRPIEGAAYDNIYTQWGDVPGSADDLDRIQGAPPTGNDTRVPMVNTDSWLYP